MATPKKTIWHQCRDWDFGPGPQKKCKRCKRGQLRPRVTRRPSKARYDFDSAVLKIDFCADCGKPITEGHPHHHCSKCLPQWQKRIDQINRAQELTYWEEGFDS